MRLVAICQSLGCSSRVGNSSRDDDVVLTIGRHPVVESGLAILRVANIHVFSQCAVRNEQHRLPKFAHPKVVGMVPIDTERSVVDHLVSVSSAKHKVKTSASQRKIVFYKD